MQAKQALGQNFLMHQATADRIADAAGLTSESTVLEIGPGTGMLTRALLARAGKVLAVETDRELVPVLKETFSSELSEGKLEVIEGDIRTFDLAKLPENYVVVANIPYYITGEIIRVLLSAPHKPQTVTILVQKEVAERIVRSVKESILSLSVKVYGIPSYKFTVPRGAFRPAPNVDSAVLQVANITPPFTNNVLETRFFEILHAGFAHKRKRLAKNLEEVSSLEKITAAFESVGLSANARAEDVPLESWKKLTGIL
jgi:16S rRNA (adenine1518-N6/adenine1519-N6)-dimethyltransferase